MIIVYWCANGEGEAKPSVISPTTVSKVIGPLKTPVASPSESVMMVPGTVDENGFHDHQTFKANDFKTLLEEENAY